MLDLQNLEGLMTKRRDCRLTPAGRDWIAGKVDLLESGRIVREHFTIEDNTPLVYLGGGNQRMAFFQTREPDTPYLSGRDCVLKLSKFDDPWQNENEIRNWTDAPIEVKELLFPITDHGENGYWLVMPRATEVGNEEAAERINARLKDLGYRMDDIRPDQVGLLDGEWRVFDHGYRLRRTDA